MNEIFRSRWLSGDLPPSSKPSGYEPTEPPKASFGGSVGASPGESQSQEVGGSGWLRVPHTCLSSRGSTTHEHVVCFACWKTRKGTVEGEPTTSAPR